MFSGSGWSVVRSASLAKGGTSKKRPSPHLRTALVCNEICLNNSLEQSPYSEDNSRSAGKKVFHLLWYPKFHYLDYNRPPLIPILSQFHPVHTLTSSFFKISINIILPSTCWFSQMVSYLQVLRLNLFINVPRVLLIYPPVTSAPSGQNILVTTLPLTSVILIQNTR
jgi:hypothetical protein